MGGLAHLQGRDLALQGDVFGFFLNFIQHCFFSRPSDSTVSEDAGIEPRTVAASTLAVRRSNHSAGSHPLSRLYLIQHSARSHPQDHNSARSSHIRQNLIHHAATVDLIHISARSHPQNRLVLIHGSARSHPPLILV